MQAGRKIFQNFISEHARLLGTPEYFTTSDQSWGGNETLKLGFKIDYTLVLFTSVSTAVMCLNIFIDRLCLAQQQIDRCGLKLVKCSLHLPQPVLH